MDFKDTLNEYIALLDCTAKVLAKSAGLSAATISRYRSGERIPDSEQLTALVNGIVILAEQRGIVNLSAESVKSTLLPLCSATQNIKFEKLRYNFDTLLTALSVSVSELSRSINYDASHISRIRNGQRQPADPQKFAADISKFIVRRYTNETELSIVAELIDCSSKDIADESVYYEKLTEWLTSGVNAAKDYPFAFLQKLDSFDLNEYIRAIHFDELKVPSVPFQLPTSKSYFGLNQMMESELDFLKATVLSKSFEPVTMYSDMPMTEMAKDPDFPKKWMFGMAMLLRKGLHLNQIHNLDRSFEDMMLGLESWIPMYMTGQISPYYLKNVQNNVFLHFLKVSGAAALSGEAIAGYHSDGKYYLTKSKKEIEYYEKRAQELLSNAKPLMDIYRSDRENEFNAFLLADAGKPGKRRSIFSALPMYTMSGELLSDILDRRNVPDDDRRRIFDHWMSQRRRVERILETESIEDEISDVTKEEFESRPISLDLSGAFFEADISYSYEDYLRHSEETEEFAASHPNYTLKKTSSHVFRNLQIHIHEGQWAMVSKGKAPAIHFVVQHPKLRGAIESFIPPVVEH